MSGMPVFKGTRVVVKNLSDYLASGYSLDVVLDDFPSVSREQANCRHIANAAIMKELRAIVSGCGYELPILCTPEELLGD